MDLKTLRQTDENVVILPGAKVNGDVTFGSGCSVWYNAVIRGDDNPIVMGKNCNVQDNAVLHPGRTPLAIGDNVTIGHSAIVHCVSVGEGTVVGMGAILVQGAVIGRNCIVGAGAVVTGKTNAPDGSMLLGNPARVVRPLTEEEIRQNYRNAEHYVEKRELYR